MYAAQLDGIAPVLLAVNVGSGVLRDDWGHSVATPCDEESSNHIKKSLLVQE